MKKFLVTLFLFLLLASGAYAQVLEVKNGVLVQYSPNYGFYGMAWAQGPKPVVGIALVKNGQPITGLETLQKTVVDPTINSMYFVVRKTDVPETIKAGDSLTVIVTDSSGATVQKTVTVSKGPGPILIALAQF